MPDVKRGPAGDLYLVVGWLALLWAIFIVDVVLRSISGIWIAYWFGLWPRDLHSLHGILTAHLLHADLGHIVTNSLGLLILGFASCRYSRKLTAFAVLYSALCAGILTWCIGSWGVPSVHVGVSGVIFGLIGWLVANGILRRDLFSIFIALLVMFLYGGALLAALPPSTTPDGQDLPISWEMHLGGLLGGMLASWHMRKAKA